ncbi:hypothetical protein LX36DRAFT_413456 [Colletotrichum falcatum]|nr:hypothetical protein LX36DRAFT_413456 [Colletotrichum falcatum]
MCVRQRAAIRGQFFTFTLVLIRPRRGPGMRLRHVFQGSTGHAPIRVATGGSCLVLSNRPPQPNIKRSKLHLQTHLDVFGQAPSWHGEWPRHVAGFSLFVHLCSVVSLLSLLRVPPTTIRMAADPHSAEPRPRNHRFFFFFSFFEYLDASAHIPKPHASSQHGDKSPHAPTPLFRGRDPHKHPDATANHKRPLSQSTYRDWNRSCLHWMAAPTGPYRERRRCPLSLQRTRGGGGRRSSPPLPLPPTATGPDRLPRSLPQPSRWLGSVRILRRAPVGMLHRTSTPVCIGRNDIGGR